VDTFSESSPDSDEIMTSGSERTDGTDANQDAEIDEQEFDSGEEWLSTADNEANI